MSVVRRRYYFWLLKAYVRRWGRTIIVSLAVGVFLFFIAVFSLNFYLLPVFGKKVQRIGYFGTYTLDNLPKNVTSDISYGLTKIQDNGSIMSGAAYKWTIKDNGKTYDFYIRRGQYFHNGRELNSESLPLNFADVTRTNIDKYTVRFELKRPYSPFLALVSKPILAKNLSGLEKYKIKKININAGYVRDLTLESLEARELKKIIIFYPTQEALKLAFALGEIDYVKNASGTKTRNFDVSSWKNVSITKKINYSELISIFYNTEDKMLSNKKIRQALSYALPSSFEEGERAYSSIPPISIYFSKTPNYGMTGIDLAKSLIEDADDLKNLTLEISATDEYMRIASKIQDAWSKIGVKSKVKTVSTLPKNFQVLIYPIKLPPDPDQYTLWHSAQVNNITKYKNLRIDKLLEDGRLTTDVEKRAVLYSDFQKYLIDDTPASFLYFPYIYELSRK